MPRVLYLQIIAVIATIIKGQIFKITSVGGLAAGDIQLKGFLLIILFSYFYIYSSVLNRLIFDIH